MEVYDGSKLLGTGTLSNGKVTIHVTKNLKSGKHTLTVKYLGSTNVAASETTVDVKVKKKKKKKTSTSTSPAPSSQDGAGRARGRPRA